MTTRHRRTYSSLLVAALVCAIVAVLVAPPSARAAADTSPPSAAPGPTSTTSPTGPSRAEHPVAPEVEATVENDGRARVLVELDDPNRATAVGVLDQLAPGSFEGQAPARPTGYLPLTVDGDGLDGLRNAAGVRAVRPNRVHRVDLARSAPAIGAPSAWASGYTGAGQTIAVVDTGVDGTHPFVADALGHSRVVAEACFSGYGLQGAGVTSMCAPTSIADQDPTTSIGPDAAKPCWPSTAAGCQHGTHVAGIAAGRAPSVGADPRAPSGIAPSATIIAVNVFSDDGSQSDCGGAANTPCVVALDSDILAGLDFVYGLRNTYSIAAVNMSFGAGSWAGTCDGSAPEASRISLLAAAGIESVVAAGNAGSSTRVSEPACVSSAVTVGSVDAATTTVSSFSNASAALDLWAPGAYQTSSRDGVVSSWPGGGYANLMGTSMAAPHVTGALAVLRSAKPGLSADQAVTVLRATGTPVTDTRATGGVTRPYLAVGAATADVPAKGSLDAATPGLQSVSVSGWALDLDADATVSVVVTLDGSDVTTLGASGAAANVPSLYPGYGSAHGFAGSVPASSGTHQVCVGAIGVPNASVRTSLGCRSVTVGGPPFGSFDTATSAAPGTADVSGWSIDPDTATPTAVDLYVDGAFTVRVPANLARADVASANPGYGSSHGFNTRLTGLTGTSHQVCTRAIDTTSPTTTTLLGCRSVSVGATISPASTRLPDGRLAVVAAASDGSVAVDTETTPDGPWGAWATLGRPVGAAATRLAAGVDAAGELVAFAVTADGNVRYAVQNGPTTWTAWATIATDARLDLEVANSADGRIELFALSAGGTTAHAWELAGGGWSGFVPTGAPLGTGLTTARNRDGRLEVFLRESDGGLRNSWQTAPNAGWSGWASMGGTSAMPPVVVANADGRLEIFATLAGGALVHSWQWRAGSAWSGWDTMGSTTGVTPVVVRNLDGRLELFATTGGGALVHSWQWQAGSAWSGWDTMGISVSRTPTVAMHLDGRLSLFTLAADSTLVEAAQVAANSPWGPWKLFPS